jgi:hypothetical protein
MYKDALPFRGRHSSEMSCRLELYTALRSLASKYSAIDALQFFMIPQTVSAHSFYRPVILMYIRLLNG